MNRNIRIRRRLQPRRLLIVGAPKIDITWNDIMQDLDPNWNTTRFDNHQSEGTR